LWINDTSYKKVFKVATRKLGVSNNLVQLLTLYTDPESHNAQHYRWMDGQHHDGTSRSYCVAQNQEK